MASFFERLQTPDVTLQALQDNIDSALSIVLKSKLIDGVLRSGVQLANGLNLVEHRLGREPLGFLIIAPEGNVAIWKDTATNAQPSKVIRIRTAGAVKTGLYFF